MILRTAVPGTISGLAAAVIWGLVPVGTRFFVQQLDPLKFSIVRFLFSGVAALPFPFMRKPWRWPAMHQRRLMLCASLAGPLYNLPIAMAARTLGAGRVGIIVATEPVFIILFSSFLSKVRPSFAAALGASICFIGVILVCNIIEAPGDSSTWAMLVALAGAISWSWYAVLVGPLARLYGAFQVTCGI